MIANRTQALAIALDETNRWFATTMARPDLRLELIDNTNARRIALSFERGAWKRRRVQWDWESIYFRKVRKGSAWMYAIVQRGEPKSMCYGRIEMGAGYVSLEYLERKPYARLRGLVTPAAFTFARTIAALMGLREVRVNQPFPRLVRYYERVLPVIRHPSKGVVEYLYWKSAS